LGTLVISSDEISSIQQIKIIADWFFISNSYAKWPARVKPKPEPPGPPVLEILAVNLTFSEIRYGGPRCHKRSFLRTRVFSDIRNVPIQEHAVRGVFFGSGR
jgi:hypothetical protein